MVNVEGAHLVVVVVLSGRHLLSQSLQTVPHLETQTQQAFKKHASYAETPPSANLVLVCEKKSNS